MDRPSYRANRLHYQRIPSPPSVCESLYCIYLDVGTKNRYGEGKSDESAVNVILDAVMVTYSSYLHQNESKKQKIEMDNVASRFPTGTSHNPLLM
jgi:hypothetical protein